MSSSCRALLGPRQPGQTLIAQPGVGTHVPLTILGSSLFGAQLAAALGLPFAFASHFSPDSLVEAVALYRERFQPSPVLAKPYVIAGVMVMAAETDRAAERLFTTTQQTFVDLFRGGDRQLRPPIDDIEAYWHPEEKRQAMRMLRYAVVGSMQTVRAGLLRFTEHAHADELIVMSSPFAHAARMHSYVLTAEAMGLKPPA